MRIEAMVLNSGVRWAVLMRGVLLIGTALTIPNLGFPQPITGPLVNALLFLSVEWTSVNLAVIVGLVTPMGAALRGILPLPLMGMIPFIGLANAILVSLYDGLKKWNRWLGLIIAAMAKALFLYGTAVVLVARPLQLEMGGTIQAVVMPDAFLTMMSWPQLVNALAGGLLAFGLQGIVTRKRSGR